MKLMTAIEVSEQFFKGKVSYQKVLRLTRDGKLPCKKYGRTYIFDEECLKEYIKKNLSTPCWAKIKL